MMIKYTTRWHCSSTNVAPFIVLSRSKKNKQWRFSFLNWKISNYLYFYQEKKLKNPTIIVHIENFVHVESTEWRVHLSRVYFHSLRCLKSAFSWLNKSVIPSADREASRSTSASAVNLQVHKNMAHAHTHGGHIPMSSFEFSLAWVRWCDSYLGMTSWTFLARICLVQLCTVAVLMCGMSWDRAASSSKGSTISMLMVFPW